MVRLNIARLKYRRWSTYNSGPPERSASSNTTKWKVVPLSCSLCMPLESHLVNARVGILGVVVLLDS